MARELLGDSGQGMLPLQLLLIDLSANDNLATGGSTDTDTYRQQQDDCVAGRWLCPTRDIAVVNARHPAHPTVLSKLRHPSLRTITTSVKMTEPDNSGIPLGRLSSTNSHVVNL